MQLKVWFTNVHDETNDCLSMVQGLVEESTASLKASAHPRFRMAHNADSADIILFIETPTHKFRDYGPKLLANELIRKYPERCFASNWTDSPAGFLPGVYTSMPRAKMNPSRFRPGGFLSMYNAEVVKLAEKTVEVDEPELLIAFSGAASSNVREKLFALSAAKPFAADVVIKRSGKWFTYDSNEKDAYARELRRSKFVLCPRGIGTSTFRLFEAMALGRAPVVLSDEWVAPSGPAWGEFALVIAEDRFAEVPDIVRKYESEWRERGQLAHAAWRQWFAPDILLIRTLEAVEEILLRRPADHDERAFQAQWTGWNFAFENGWTMPQKMADFAKSGTLMKRVLNKIAPGKQAEA